MMTLNTSYLMPLRVERVAVTIETDTWLIRSLLLPALSPLSLSPPSPLRLVLLSLCPSLRSALSCRSCRAVLPVLPRPVPLCLSSVPVLVQALESQLADVRGHYIKKVRELHKKLEHYGQFEIALRLSRHRGRFLVVLEPFLESF